MKSQHLSVLLVALTCLSVSTQALATVPGASSSIDYGNIHGHMTVSNPTILGVSSGSFLQNQAVVAPGAEITLSFDAGVSVTSLAYCPGCIMQEYLAWTGPALTAGATPQQINLFNDQFLQDIPKQTFTWTTKAPTLPGEYFIAEAGTLDYHFVPVVGRLGGMGGELASFKVTVAAVPEPSTFALMCVGLLASGVRLARNRRRASGASA